MILELTLMIVSVAVMIGILVHKHLEVSRGVVVTSLDAVREKADPVLRDIHQKTSKIFSDVTPHNALLILTHVFVHTVRLFMYLSDKVHTVSSSIIMRASKKTEDLSRSGAASFYLKQIKEAKESGEIDG